jgi:peroxiredoxin Q/BCP
VLGVSADRPAAQARFVERLGVPFPMLCDPEGRTLRAYGVRRFPGYARRASFLIDAGGAIRAVYPRVSPSTHAAEVLKDLKALVGKC